MKLFRTRVVKHDGGYIGGDYHSTIFSIQLWHWAHPFTWTNASDSLTSDFPFAVATAKALALADNGIYIGVFDPSVPSKLKKIQRRIQNAIRSSLRGPTGIPGAPGPQGPMGARGPAYDDVQCPHCTRRRSQTKRTLFMEVMGGGKFGYTCGHCNKVSLWTPVNGLWVADKVETKEKAYD